VNKQPSDKHVAATMRRGESELVQHFTAAAAAAAVPTVHNLVILEPVGSSTSESVMTAK
jgi:hypothetical protein